MRVLGAACCPFRGALLVKGWPPTAGWGLGTQMVAHILATAAELNDRANLDLYLLAKDITATLATRF